jgi:hypothetical protein
MLRSVLAAFGMCLLAACASSSTAVTPSKQETVFESTGGVYSFQFYPDERIVADTLSITPSAAWSSIARAYADAGLPPGVAQEGMRTYGVPRATVRRALAGVPMSRLLRCGATMGIENADSYSVTLSMVSKLRPIEPNRVEVETQLRASAVPTGVSSNPVTCATTGELERRINNLLEYHATPR